MEGIVIDWEENPLAGWVITLTSDISGFTPITTVSAMEPDDNGDDPSNGNHDDKGKGKKYNFEYPESDNELEKGEFEFTEDDIAGAISHHALASKPEFTPLLSKNALVGKA